MEKLKCIIVDDERIARKGLSNHIERVDFLETVDKCSSAEEAMEILNEQKVDLLFLDIEMPKISGISLLKSLRHPPLVIITSAYEEYALEGFELEVCDFLLKPIGFERFLKAVNKAHKLWKRQQMPTSRGASQEELYVKGDHNKYIKLKVKDICYIEAQKDYVFIHTETDRIMVLVNLKNILTQLPSTQFSRIHKSYAVAYNKISALRGNELFVCGERLPLGRKYKASITELIEAKLISRDGK
jgi:DNA-binding LytR/AlgR family response regulator